MVEECSRGCHHHSCPHDGNITEGGVGTSTLGRTQGGLEELQVVEDTREVICTQKDEGRLLVLSGQEVVQEGSWVLKCWYILLHMGPVLGDRFQISYSEHTRVASSVESNIMGGSDRFGRRT